jgi:hypothetical protein
MPQLAMGSSDRIPTETLPKFPNWFRQLIGFGTLLVGVTIAYANLKSDVRDQSTRLEQTEAHMREADARAKEVEQRLNAMAADLAEIKADMRYVRRSIEGRPH